MVLPRWSTFRDAAGWSVLRGDYVAYTVRVGNRAVIKFGKVTNSTSSELRLIGANWRGGIQSRESKISYSSRVLLIEEGQVPSNILPGLKSWPSKV